MGVLKNPKWERFSQEIVRGRAAPEAYATAGFRYNRGNASRLRLHEAIKARIAELMAFKTAAVEAEALSAAERAGVDAFWVVRGLRRNATLAARRGDIAASNRAIELIGKHLNMFVDRKAIEISYTDDADEYLARLLQLVQAPIVEGEAQQVKQLEHNTEDGLKYG